MPLTLAVLTMAVGLFLVLRATVIIASGTEGRFRSDPWVSITVGFALVFLGQWLLR